MTPALTPVKFRKTTCDSHLVKRRNMAVFSLDLLILTTCHSKKLKFRPPMEKPRPALRGGVAGRGTRKRPPAFILLLSVPRKLAVQGAHKGLHCWDGSGAAGAESGAHRAALG